MRIIKINFKNREVFNGFNSVGILYRKLLKKLFLSTSVIMVVGIIISTTVPFWPTEVQSSIFFEFKNAGEIRQAGSGIPKEMELSITPLIIEGLEQLEVSAQRIMQKVYDTGYARAILFIFILIIVLSTAYQIYKEGKADFYEVLFKFLWLVILMSVYTGITNTGGVFHSIVYFPFKTLLKDMPAFIMDSSNLASGFYAGIFQLFDTTDGIGFTDGLKLVIIGAFSLIGIVGYAIAITLIIILSFINFYVMYAISPIFIILLGSPKTRGYVLGVFNLALTAVITINLLAVYVTLMRGFTSAVSTNSGFVGMVVVCIFTYASNLLVFTIPAWASTIAGGAFGSAESASPKALGGIKKGFLAPNQAMKSFKGSGVVKWLKKLNK